MNNPSGNIIAFSGVSGVGKTEVAHQMAIDIQKQGKLTEVYMIPGVESICEFPIRRENNLHIQMSLFLKKLLLTVSSAQWAGRSWKFFISDGTIVDIAAYTSIMVSTDLGCEMLDFAKEYIKSYKVIYFIKQPDGIKDANREIADKVEKEMLRMYDEIKCKVTMLQRGSKMRNEDVSLIFQIKKTSCGFQMEPIVERDGGITYEAPGEFEYSEPTKRLGFNVHVPIGEPIPEEPTQAPEK